MTLVTYTDIGKTEYFIYRIYWSCYVLFIFVLAFCFNVNLKLHLM